LPGVGDKVKSKPVWLSAGSAALEPYQRFPTHVLPEPIRLFVETCARAIGCDESFIAMPLLAAVASASRIRVPSPKTAHHEGKDSRVIPIFPELMPYLRDAFDAAEPGTEYIINRYRDSNANLRTQLMRIIQRAGRQPWPKVFHNLRATRETELAEDFSLHVVCAWIGNSQPVAAKHYLQVTDEHFARAIAGNSAEPTRAAGKAAQKAAQQPHATTRRTSHVEGGQSKNPACCGALRDNAADCEVPGNSLMPPQGLEP
jgi:hypothetical protein